MILFYSGLGFFGRPTGRPKLGNCWYLLVLKTWFHPTSLFSLLLSFFFSLYPLLSLLNSFHSLNLFPKFLGNHMYTTFTLVWRRIFWFSLGNFSQFHLSLFSAIISKTFPDYSVHISSKRQRSEKSKQSESSSRHKNVFVSDNAMFKHSVICNKHVISGRFVVLVDFEHLNLAPILRTSSLEYFVTIKEQVYPELVQYFYSYLTFHDNRIQSRVKNVDINITLERFARIFSIVF